MKQELRGRQTETEKMVIKRVEREKKIKIKLTKNIGEIRKMNKRFPEAEIGCEEEAGVNGAIKSKTKTEKKTWRDKEERMRSSNR